MIGAMGAAFVPTAFAGPIKGSHDHAADLQFVDRLIRIDIPKSCVNRLYMLLTCGFVGYSAEVGRFVGL
jgi:hypothetical protein